MALGGERGLGLQLGHRRHPAAHDLEQAQLDPGVAADAPPALLDSLGPGVHGVECPTAAWRAVRYGGSTSAIATAARIRAPPASWDGVSASPVSPDRTAAKTGSSSRMRAAREGLTTRCAHNMAAKARAVANTPVKAAAPSAPADRRRSAVARLAARQAKPTVVTWTQVKRMASWRPAVSPTMTRWAAKATAQPRVRDAPLPKLASAPPVSRTRPATAGTRPASVSG